MRLDLFSDDTIVWQSLQPVHRNTELRCQTSFANEFAISLYFHTLTIGSASQLEGGQADTFLQTLPQPFSFGAPELDSVTF